MSCRIRYTQGFAGLERTQFLKRSSSFTCRQLFLFGIGPKYQGIQGVPITAESRQERMQPLELGADSEGVLASHGRALSTKPPQVHRTKDYLESAGTSTGVGAWPEHLSLHLEALSIQFSFPIPWRLLRDFGMLLLPRGEAGLRSARKVVSR